MSYNYVKECVRNTLHTGVDYVIPSHPLIGAISGGVGYYTHIWTLTNSPQKLVKFVEGQTTAFFSTAFSFSPTFLEELLGLQAWASSIGNFCGYLFAPFVVPQASHYLADRLPIAAALATSLTLNIIAQQFFGIKIKKEGKNIEHLVQSLKDIGIEIPSNTKKPHIQTQESYQSPFKDIVFPSELSNSPVNISAIPVVVSKETIEEKKEKNTQIVLKKRPPIPGPEELKKKLKTPQKLNPTPSKKLNHDLFDDNNGCAFTNLCC
jgi:hypothetical protein